MPSRFAIALLSSWVERQEQALAYTHPQQTTIMHRDDRESKWNGRSGLFDCHIATHAAWYPCCVVYSPPPRLYVVKRGVRELESTGGWEACTLNPYYLFPSVQNGTSRPYSYHICIWIYSRIHKYHTNTGESSSKHNIPVSFCSSVA